MLELFPHVRATTEMVVHSHSFLRKQPDFPFFLRPLGHMQLDNSMPHIAHSYSNCRANFKPDYSFLVFKVHCPFALGRIWLVLWSINCWWHYNHFTYLSCMQKLHSMQVSNEYYHQYHHHHQLYNPGWALASPSNENTYNQMCAYIQGSPVEIQTPPHWNLSCHDMSTSGTVLSSSSSSSSHWSYSLDVPSVASLLHSVCCLGFHVVTSTYCTDFCENSYLVL